jgi:predicted phage terminase large subunit-like protein
MPSLSSVFDLDTIPESNSEANKQIAMLADEKIRRKCLESYAFFVRRAWDIIEPGTELQWNWHLDAICEELQKQAIRIHNKEPKEYDLIFCIPPRSLKSTIISKCLTPWVWTFSPHQRFVYSANAEKLSLEHSVDSRNIIQSDWYRNLWPEVQITSDQNEKIKYLNSASGYRMITSVGGNIIGSGGDWINTDDIISREEAESQKYRDRAIRWWTKTMFSRLNDKKIGIRTMTNQRLHQEDPTGYILTHQRKRYKLFCFPAELGDNVEPKEYKSKYENGLLFPARIDMAAIAEAKENLGYEYAGQYLQNPSPPEGGVLKRYWWKFWRPIGSNLPNVTVKIGDTVHTCETVDLPEEFDDTISTWDMTFKDLTTSDYVVGQVWSSSGPNKFLIDQHRAKLDILKSVIAVKDMKLKYPRISGIYIEDAANGPAAMAELRREIPGIIAAGHGGKNKHARAMPMIKQAQAGNLYLPHPSLDQWVNDFIDECSLFPNGTHDDMWDTAGMGVDKLSSINRIFSTFNGTRVDFNIGFTKLQQGSQLIISQWVEQNMRTSIILALWSPINGRLAIWGECELPSPSAEGVIIPLMKLVRDISNTPIINLQNFQWYGSQLMFGNKTESSIGDIQSTYSKYGIYPYKNDRYDERGSVSIIATMIFREKFLVHDRCELLCRQMLSWSIVKNKFTEGHGMARALCLMVSSLGEIGAFNSITPKQKPYSQIRTKTLMNVENIDKANLLEKPTEQIRRSLYQKDSSMKPNSPNAWYGV